MKRILILCLAFSAVAAAADPVDAGGRRDGVLHTLIALEQTGGDPDLAFVIGVRYANMHDDAEAEKWLRKATDGGVADAQFTLGVMYGLGRGVRHDEAEGLRLVSLAAAQGHADALEVIDRLNRDNEWAKIRFCQRRL